MSATAQPYIFGVHCSGATLVEAQLKLCHVLVKLIQIDVRQYGTDDSALRRAAVALMHTVIFHVARVQEFPNQAQETLIFDSFAENANHDIMVNVVEEAFNISFHKPFTSNKAVLNHPQRRVTASIRAEAVRGALKTDFVNCFQQHSSDLLYQLVVK